MKTLLLTFSFLTMIHANAHEAYVPVCIDEAKALLSAKIGRPVQDISFYNGGFIGDGVSVVEPLALKVKGVDGFYILNMTLDDCSVFLGPKKINN